MGGVGPALQQFRTDMQPGGGFFPDDLRAAMKDGTVSFADGEVQFAYENVSGNIAHLQFGYRHK